MNATHHDQLGQRQLFSESRHAGPDMSVIASLRSSPAVYAGVGSRSTPPAVLASMRRTAEQLARAGFTLRSGAADGADAEFEAGANLADGQCEIYVPWRSFGNRAKPLVLDAMPGCNDAFEIAAPLHPSWASLRAPVRRLMARNVFQVLGRDCASPVRFVLCWTPKWSFDQKGEVCDASGGTGLAVRLAYSRGIRVFHLGIPEHASRIEAFCCRQELATDPRTAGIQ